MAATMLSTLDTYSWHTPAPAEGPTSTTPDTCESSAVAKHEDPLSLAPSEQHEDQSRPRSTVLFALPEVGPLDVDDEDFPRSPQEKGDTSIFAALQLPLETLTSPEMVVIHYGHSLALPLDKHAAMPRELAKRGLTAEVLYETASKVHKLKSSASRRRSLSCAGLGFLLSHAQITAHDKRVSDQVNAALERTNRQLAAARVGVRFAWVSNQLRGYWDAKE